MRAVDCYKIARGNLVRSKLRSSLTMLGIIVSIASIVMLVSLGVGLQKLSVERIASINALNRITVTAQEGSSQKLTDKSADDIRQIVNVVNVSKEVQFPTKLTFVGTQSEAIAIGIEKDNLTFSDIKITSGRAYEDNAKEILLSKGALKLFGKENDPGGILDKDIALSVIYPGNDKNALITKDFTAKVVGVTADDAIASVYAPLSFLKIPEVKNYSSFTVKVPDRQYIKTIKSKIETMGYTTTTITDLIDQIDQVFLYFQIILGIIGSIALFVAAIGIINTMTISLLERTHEIGIMKAVGASDWDICKMFITESGIMGFRGAIYGLGWGWFLGKSINAIIALIIKSNGVTDKMELFVLPLDFAIFVAAIAVTLALFAGVYPAMRAARLSPLQALKSQ